MKDVNDLIADKRNQLCHELLNAKLNRAAVTRLARELNELYSKRSNAGLKPERFEEINTIGEKFIGKVAAGIR